MERFAEKHLKSWFIGKTRKPLIIRGARQVGKSTMVRMFAKNSKLKLLEINLEEHNELRAAFESMKIEVVIDELEGFFQTDFSKALKARFLLFIDEIQAIPPAIAILRYFYEKYPHIPVVAAGSLLEFALAEVNFSMPVGRVEFLWLHPMTFEEVLRAKGEDFLLEALQSFNFVKELPQTTHEAFLQKLKEYFLTGGMPEAVHASIESDNAEDTLSAIRSIAQTYESDFGKYAKKNDYRLVQLVYRTISGQVGKKLKYVNISRQEPARDLQRALSLLERAGVIFLVKHSSANGIPLSAEQNERIFKPIVLDTGIYLYLQGIRSIPLSQMIRDDFVNKGALAEQFAGQQLIRDQKERPELFYWLRQGKANNAEVDYVIQADRDVVPLEIKAGSSGRLKSIHQFCLRKGRHIGLRLDMNRPSRQEITAKVKTSKKTEQATIHMISLPLYMTGQAHRLVANEGP